MLIFRANCCKMKTYIRDKLDEKSSLEIKEVLKIMSCVFLK